MTPIRPAPGTVPETVRVLPLCDTCERHRSELTRCTCGHLTVSHRLDLPKGPMGCGTCGCRRLEVAE